MQGAGKSFLETILTPCISRMSISESWRIWTLFLFRCIQSLKIWKRFNYKNIILANRSSGMRTDFVLFLKNTAKGRVPSFVPFKYSLYYCYYFCEKKETFFYWKVIVVSLVTMLLQRLENFLISQIVVRIHYTIWK